MKRDGYAAVIGTFDGVHRGHVYLLENLKLMASRRGLGTCVYTFTDHPLATLRPSCAPGLLTTTAEKLRLLDSAGVDRVEVTDFGKIASMTAADYIRYLSSQGVRLILIGYDNRFGCDGLLTLSQFRGAASGTGVEIEQADELTAPGGGVINSSAVRNCLSQGDVTGANELLGYEYSLTGTVVTGKQLGRTIGFPTANVGLPANCRKLMVANGVYACKAFHEGVVYQAMVNIGHRPTVDALGAPVSIEAHLVGCDLDMYGSKLTLRFVERLRDEQRFTGVEALRAQLQLDCEAVRKLLG